MSSYKTEFTLNEKDSLTDMLITEKTLVQFYVTALNEGLTKSFMTVVKSCFMDGVATRGVAENGMVKHGYGQTLSNETETEKTIKARFLRFKESLN